MNFKRSIFFQQLYKLKNDAYKAFVEKLIPNIDKESILGVKTQDINTIAKHLLTNEKEKLFKFLNDLPHFYHEENLLHCKILCLMEDYSLLIENINNFLPHINNWMLTDSLIPKIFSKNKNKLLYSIYRWISLEKVYSIRYAIVISLKFLLSNELFDKGILKIIHSIKNNDYYIKMAISWFFSEAIIRQYSATIKYLEKKKFDKWIQNKIISKCNESHRLSPEIKTYLKTLRIKK